MIEHLNTAARLHREGMFADAEKLYRDHLRAHPANAKILLALGHICYMQGRIAESIKYLEHARKVEPGNPEIHFTLADLYRETGHWDQAISSYRQAITLRPGNNLAWLNLGVVYYQSQRYAAAIEALSRAASLDGRNEKTFHNLGLAMMRAGRATEADQMFRRARDINPGNEAIYTALLFNLHNIPGLTQKETFEEHQRWATRFAAELPSITTRSAAAPAVPRTKIHVGYISPDFRRHSVSFFIKPILEAHDRTVVKCYCYSDVANADEITQQLMGIADHWRDISALNDEQAFRLIQQDHIDILVDLAGHTNRNRLRMMSKKPAPVQLSYLGYPGTTGLRAIDYRLTDAQADPEGEFDRFYTEKLVRLENGFLCYEPFVEPPIQEDTPMHRNGFITFGSFNNLAKINDDVIHAWAAILQRLPTAKLLLKARGLGDSSGRTSVYSGFQRFGISQNRVECLGHMINLDQHLDTYNRIDIALDTFPYNGTTTTCEALWMGVPVITFSGDRHVSRVGTSLLTSVGLTKCIATGRQAYVDLAVRLAVDTDTLADIRGRLRERMRGSSLMDAASFCQRLESHYRKMLQKSTAESNTH